MIYRDQLYKHIHLIAILLWFFIIKGPPRSFHVLSEWRLHFPWANILLYDTKSFWKYSGGKCGATIWGGYEAISLHDWNNSSNFTYRPFQDIQFKVLCNERNYEQVFHSEYSREHKRNAKKIHVCYREWSILTTRLVSVLRGVRNGLRKSKFLTIHFCFEVRGFSPLPLCWGLSRRLNCVLRDMLCVLTSATET